jgi:hypothetical protein
MFNPLIPNAGFIYVPEGARSLLKPHNSLIINGSIVYLLLAPHSPSNLRDPLTPNAITFILHYSFPSHSPFQPAPGRFIP